MNCIVDGWMNDGARENSNAAKKHRMPFRCLLLGKYCIRTPPRHQVSLNPTHTQTKPIHSFHPSIHTRIYLGNPVGWVHWVPLGPHGLLSFFLSSLTRRKGSVTMTG